MLSSISFDLKFLFTVVSVVRDVCTVCMCNSHLRTLPPLLLLLYVCEAKLIEFISPLHFHLILSAWFLCICVKFVYGCLFIWTLYIVVGVVVCNIKYIHHIFGIHPGIDVFASHDCSTAYLFHFMFTQFFFYLLRFNLIPPSLLSMQEISNEEIELYTQKIESVREGQIFICILANLVRRCALFLCGWAKRKMKRAFCYFVLNSIKFIFPNAKSF